VLEITPTAAYFEHVIILFIQNSNYGPERKKIDHFRGLNKEVRVPKTIKFENFMLKIFYSSKKGTYVITEILLLCPPSKFFQKVGNFEHLLQHVKNWFKNVFIILQYH